MIKYVITSILILNLYACSTVDKNIKTEKEIQYIHLEDKCITKSNYIEKPILFFNKSLNTIEDKIKALLKDNNALKLYMSQADSLMLECLK